MDINNPWIVLICLLACWPGIIPAALAFYIGRRGSPLAVKWRGLDYDRRQQGDDLDLV